MKRLGVVLVASAMAASAATADTLQPGKVYGNSEGCACAKTGQFPGTDSYVVITTRYVQQIETSCELVQALVGKYGDIFANAICSGEGETWPQTYVLSALTEDGSFTVTTSDGSYLGSPDDALKLCDGVTMEQADKVFGG